MVAEIERRFRANLVRVGNLISLHEFLQVLHDGRVDVLHTDLLRAAVVLLHASLEDLLRSLAELRLPEADPRFLDRIPLVSFDRPQGGKAKFNFNLGDLSTHRGMSVEEVIRLSVLNHLNASNFNHPGDIKNLVESIGADPKLVDPYADALASMIGRRHLIAHRADGEFQEETGVHSPRPIAVEVVEIWKRAVDAFGTALLSSL